MPQIGWFEILIIAAIAIIVIGPKDFPFVLKKVGSWIGTAKRYVNNFQNEISTLENDTVDTISPKDVDTISPKDKEKDLKNDKE
tara:strand:- start:184 stop:435 length:252 start_codon:yes stop_codon:yes gene_type:complete